MGGVPTKHHSKSKVGRRRSQLALKKRDLVKCKQCGGPSFSHRACIQCGFYPAGKSVAPKAEKKAKEAKQEIAEKNAQEELETTSEEKNSEEKKEKKEE